MNLHTWTTPPFLLGKSVALPTSQNYKKQPCSRYHHLNPHQLATCATKASLSQRLTCAPWPWLTNRANPKEKERQLSVCFRGNASWHTFK